jgi:hypothetical protein
MTLELMLHGLDVQSLARMPIDSFIDLFEKHIESQSMMGMQMPFGMGTSGAIQEDKYSSKTWKENGKQYSRVNVLEGAGVAKTEGLRSSRNKT